MFTIFFEISLRRNFLRPSNFSLKIVVLLEHSHIYFRTIFSKLQLKAFKDANFI